MAPNIELDYEVFDDPEETYYASGTVVASKVRAKLKTIQ
jgi:hypothetical protein